MKKLILRIAIAVVALVVVAVVILFLNLNSLVKKSVETVGPRLTRTPVHLDGVSLSPFSGSGQLKGFLVGNPEGYKTASAIKMGAVKVALKPSSLLSDTIVVDEVNIQGAEITYEGGLTGANNLSQLLDNIEAAGGGKSKPAEPTPKPVEQGAEKRFSVKDLVFTGGKIHVSATFLGGKQITVPLPELRVQNIGTPENGVTAAEMSRQIMQPLLVAAIKAAGEALAKASKDVQEIGKEIGKELQDKTKGIRDLFKK